MSNFAPFDPRKRNRRKALQHLKNGCILTGDQHIVEAFFCADYQTIRSVYMKKGNMMSCHGVFFQRKHRRYFSADSWQAHLLKLKYGITRRKRKEKHSMLERFLSYRLPEFSAWQLADSSWRRVSFNVKSSCHSLTC